MNNLKYYNHSLAYDYSLFEERKGSADKNNIVKLKTAKMPSVKAQKKQAKQVSVGFSAAFITVMVLGLLCANLYLRAQVTEVNAQINKVKSEINVLQGEETRLSVEYENIISYQNLEKAATSLGMKKMDKSQVVYIRVNDLDVAKTGSGELIDVD